MHAPQREEALQAMQGLRPQRGARAWAFPATGCASTTLALRERRTRDNYTRSFLRAPWDSFVNESCDTVLCLHLRLRRKSYLHRR